tara:strand:+ start:2695 stop:3015 length:321 start_codon:yes stop_codon:yes gene_type:complete
MALTYRSVKGSALTITELDDNFRYFTGSHSVTGSLDINGGLIVTGSIELVDGGSLVGGGVNLTGSFSGSFSGSIDGAELFVGNLPSADPGVAGQLYNDSGTIKISL